MIMQIRFLFKSESDLPVYFFLFGMKVLSSTFISLCLLFEEFHIRFFPYFIFVFFLISYSFFPLFHIRFFPCFLAIHYSPKNEEKCGYGYCRAFLDFLALRDKRAPGGFSVIKELGLDSKLLKNLYSLFSRVIRYKVSFSAFLVTSEVSFSAPRLSIQ